MQHLVDELGMESIVSAKNVTANLIMSYVRAMKNSMGSANIETVYQLINAGKKRGRLLFAAAISIST